VVAIVLLTSNGLHSSSRPATTKTITREQVAAAGSKPATTKTVTETKSEAAGDDLSLVGRAFRNDATPYLFEIFLAGLIAFAVGAFTQRILVGAYGITVGPVTVPELEPIKSDEADRAVSQITESPAIGRLLRPGPRGPQPFPQYMRIEDQRMQLLSFRVELEEVLRDLADAVHLDRDIPARRLPSRLADARLIDGEAAAGLEGVLSIGDQIAMGASYTDEVAGRLTERAGDVLYAYVS
jgi:hypothetical protein